MIIPYNYCVILVVKCFSTLLQYFSKHAQTTLKCVIFYTYRLVRSNKMPIDKLKNLLQQEKERVVKQKMATPVDSLPMDAIKKAMLELSLDPNIVLIPLSADDEKKEENQHTIILTLEATLSPEPIDEFTNHANHALPAPKLSFACKTRAEMTEEEAKLLEQNATPLESAFESFKKEIGSCGMQTNNCTAVLRIGSMPINLPKALYPLDYIMRNIYDKLSKEPGNAPAASRKQQEVNEVLHHSPHYHTPFPTTPRPSGIRAH